MLVSRLEKKFGYNKPIFTEDIINCMNDFSYQRIYQLIADAVEKETLIRFDKGVYYLPINTEFGRSTITVNDVVNKKYISNNMETFGIYGKYVIELNFDLSSQVPNIIEVITNRESRDVREIEIGGRKVILRKSRLVITNDNQYAYTLMELFNNISVKQYNEDSRIRERISQYIKKYKICSQSIYDMALFFPAKTMKNLATTGVLNEITQQ